MGDIGDTFNAYRVESKDRKANNRQQSLQILLDRGFTVRVYNGDAHLQLEFAVWLVDFWPGTGKWIFWRKPKVYGNRPHFEGRGGLPPPQSTGKKQMPRTRTERDAHATLEERAALEAAERRIAGGFRYPLASTTSKLPRDPYWRVVRWFIGAVILLAVAGAFGWI